MPSLLKTLSWGVLSVLLFVFFYSGISVNWYSSLLYGIAIVGPVAIIFCSIMFMRGVLTLIPQSVLANSEPEKDALGCFAGVFMIGGFFALAILFIFNESRLMRSEYENYGVFAEAVVVDGSSFSTRRVDMTSLKVQFTKEDGKLWTAHISIGKGEFQNFYLHQRIPIVYSRRYPTLARIIRSEEEMMKLLKHSKSQ